MRFATHGTGDVHDIKIDWDAAVERTDELRAAIAPHDLDILQVGVLRKGYAIREVTYPRGTLALRIGHAHEVFLQLPPEHIPPPPAPRPPPPPPETWTVETTADASIHRVVIAAAGIGERLDLLITEAVGTMSRSTVQRLISDGVARINGVVAFRPGQRLRRGETIDVTVPVAAPDAP